MPVTTVLDSLALLTFLRGETGDGQVAALLEQGGLRDTPLHMPEVSYAEVKFAILRQDGAEGWEVVAHELPTLPIDFHPVDRALADLAADYKSRFNLRLTDACAAALAKKLKAELVTGDPELKVVEKEIKIIYLK